MPNRLAAETSPYLLQHAGNPVDWYPWGHEALERAKDEDRPILLSVGYSSCHWCHVMERESFENPSIARLMNDLFVNIKVDREERPDIDQIYMKAVQAMSGRGGWPMTVFLTPDGIPFFGGTYYPPEPRPGIPSFPDLLNAIHEAWQNRRDEVQEGSTRLLVALEKASTPSKSGLTASLQLVDSAVSTLNRRYDSEYGGFGAAPKFPQPVTLELLLRHYARTGERASLIMAVNTLKRMAAGGMRDHVGGGFHRYSVDARWLVPHFEKMLYDNALLARVYLNAWKLTGSDDLVDIVTEVLDDLIEDFTDVGGGFYSARDADSEGVEGRFYVWSPDKVSDALGDEAELFCRAYDITHEGNFEGESILHLPDPIEAVAKSEGIPVSELEAILTRGRAALLKLRNERVEPFRDEKIIVSWNAFAIRAFADAGAALGRSDYVERAIQAAEFIWSEMRENERLLHSSIEGRTSGLAYLDDVAGLGNALLSLHAATLDSKWLDRAFSLADEVLDLFFDEESGTVFDSAHDMEDLIVRPRDATDGATPSGPSLAAELFARAGALKNDIRYRQAARSIVDHEVESMEEFGTAFGRMLSVVDRLEANPVEVALFVPADSDPIPLLTAVHEYFLPGGVIAGIISDQGEPDKKQTGNGPTEGTPLFLGRGPLNGQPTAYVCEHYVCDLAQNDPAALRDRLARTRT